MIIEKGHGPILDKIRIIQLIEANLQLVTRILINNRNKPAIKNDKRLSKCNYGSQPLYSIENTILEKRLVYDYSRLTTATTIHNMIDLKSCYNRQLLQIRSIIEESVGIERKLIKLIANLLLVMKYHVCTVYSVSESYYSREQDQTAGTGQGNIISSSICCDSLCFLIKDIKEKELGIIIKDPINENSEQ